MYVCMYKMCVCVCVCVCACVHLSGSIAYRSTVIHVLGLGQRPFTSNFRLPFQHLPFHFIELLSSSFFCIVLPEIPLVSWQLAMRATGVPILSHGLVEDVEEEKRVGERRH